MVALPRGIRPPEMRRYSRSGILLSMRAGVKREKSPVPPPPGPFPEPPAPVPVPAAAAPEDGALPRPAIGAATIGVLAGTTIFGLGATTGVGFGFLRGRAGLVLRPFGSLCRRWWRRRGGRRLADVEGLQPLDRVGDRMDVEAGQDRCGEGGVDKQNPGHRDGPVLRFSGPTIMRHASCTCALLNAFTGQKVCWC